MALAAVLISALALVVGALALGWQIASWTLDGRRTRVVARFGLRVAGGVLAAPLKKDGTPMDFSTAHVPGGLGAELLGVEVSNMSRSARVRVESVAATVDGGPSFDPQGTALGKPLPHWLEAGETESWYMDAEIARQLVRITRQSGKNVDSVAMFVKVSPGLTIKARQGLHVP
jgi:hypothetical protein